jgi:hypothetical protein
MHVGGVLLFGRPSDPQFFSKTVCEYIHANDSHWERFDEDDDLRVLCASPFSGPRERSGVYVGIMRTSFT